VGTGTPDPGERLHHAILSVDLVSAGQELARRFLAHDVAPGAAVGGEQEGWVGRAALELADLKAGAEVFDGSPQVVVQARHIEAMGLRDVGQRRCMPAHASPLCH
jgi:hypothetical protein